MIKNQNIFLTLVVIFLVIRVIEIDEEAQKRKSQKLQSNKVMASFTGNEETFWTDAFDNK